MPSRRARSGRSSAAATQSPSAKPRSAAHDVWKGLAIWAVVIIHVLSNLPHEIFYQDSTRWVYALIDQGMRWCVPLFVALSGYGLMMGYHRSFGLLHYLQRRVSRLLPPYIWWSFICWLVFWVVPSWNGESHVLPFWRQLVWGRADYQMYFVPMLVQLYLLFPLLRPLVQKWPRLVLAAAVLIQLAVTMNATTIAAGTNRYEWVGTHYLWATAWIGYFVLGMQLALSALNGQRSRWLRLGWYGQGLMAVIATAVSSWLATRAMQHGTDPLVALRFTRWPVNWLGVSVVVWAVMKVPVPVSQLGDLIAPVIRFLSWCGRASFVIFLSHTLMLRLYFSKFGHAPDSTTWNQWLLAAGLVGVGLVGPSLWGWLRKLTARGAVASVR